MADGIDRFALTKKHTDDARDPAVTRYGTWVAPDIDTSVYTLFSVKVQHLMRMDLIAHEVYGDDSLWWVIARANGIKNPLTDMAVGDVLRIPEKSNVMAALAAGITE